MPGMFDEFLKPKEIKPVPYEESVQPIPTQEIPKASGLFDEFVSDPSKDSPVLDSGLFNEFKANNTVKPTGMFDDLIKKEASGEPLKIITSLGKIAKEVSTSGLVAPSITMKPTKALIDLDQKLFGAIDPIKFQSTDFIPTPFRMLTTASKIFQREEATVAQPAINVTKGALDVAEGNKSYLDYLKEAPGNIVEGLAAGIHGKSKSEFKPGEQAQLGDVARLMDAPEPIAALFGLATQAALPTSILLGQITPALKLFSKADDLVTNAVARKLLINQFKDSTIELKAVKEAVMNQIAKTDLPEETVTAFLNEIHAAESKGSVAKLFLRQEEKQVAKTAAKKSGRSSFITAAHGVKKAYEETMTAPRVLDMHDGFQEYQGINARLGKALNIAETNANYTSRRLTHNFLEEVQSLGFDSVPEELDFKLAINSFARQGEEDAVKKLLASKGLIEVPKLTPAEGKILDLAEQYLNTDVEQLAKSYEKVTGNQWIKVKHYSAPLRYIDEPVTDAGKLVRRNYKREITKEMASQFKGRVENQRIPRSDFLNLVTAQLHDQQWMIHTTDRVETTRKFLAHPLYAKNASKDTLAYWGEYLSAISNRGTNATQSGMQAMLKKARLDLNSAVLGYRLSSIMIQPFAVFDAMAYAASKWGPKAAMDVLNEVGRTWINPRMANEYIRSSKALVTRQGGELAIRESIDALSSTTTTKVLKKLVPSLVGSKTLDKVDAGYRAFMARGFKLLQEADVRTAAGVHKGLKKIMAKHGIPNSQSEVDFLMSLMSGTSDVTMRPLVLSRGEMSKMWFTFQTFILNRWGITAHDLIGSGIINAGKQREVGIKAATKLFEDPQIFEGSIKKSKNYAILSAEKQGLSDSEKAIRTQSLLSDLRSAGFKPIPAEWNYGGLERSFLVPGMTEGEALDLGKKYSQESVLSPRGIIYTDGSGYRAARPFDTVFEKVGESRQIPKLENKAFYLRTNPNKEVLVYRNPTQANINDLNRAFKVKWPKSPPGEPRIRSTYDPNGNEYSWMAGDMVHSEIEHSLDKLLNKTHTQHLGQSVQELPEMTDYYTKVKIGDKEIKFQTPIDGIEGPKTPLDYSKLSRPVHPHNAATMRYRAAIGLGLIGAAEISEQQARQGIYRLTTGSDQKPQSVAQTLMMAIPGNIPYFGSIFNAINRNSSALPPAMKTVENMFRGAKKLITSDKESQQVKGALQATQSAASLALGIPGTSQLFDLLHRMIPDEHPKFRFKKSKIQKMRDRMKRG